MKVPKQPILVVEDDDVDVMAIRRALTHLHVANPVVRKDNGEKAIHHLRDHENEKPCIILLDLYMPVMDGIEFLKVIKSDERLKRIPVLVLTTSAEQQDKVDSFNLGVAGYVSKPVGYGEFIDAMRSIDLYWSLGERR